MSKNRNFTKYFLSVYGKHADTQNTVQYSANFSFVHFALCQKPRKIAILEPYCLVIFTTHSTCNDTSILMSAFSFNYPYSHTE
nr:MAG TPA: hypothetical protein [Caudoviricetes sp.]